MEVNNCREIKARYLLIMSNFRSVQGRHLGGSGGLRTPKDL